jgi:hypothetical protein
MRLTNYYLGVYFFTYVTTNHRETSSSADSDISDRYHYGGGVDRFYNRNVNYNIYTRPPEVGACTIGGVAIPVVR